MPSRSNSLATSAWSKARSSSRRGTTSARSSSVRATVVHGMARAVWTSSLGSARTLCTWIPARERALAVVVTSIWARLVGRRPNERCGGMVAEDGALPDRQHRGHPPSLYSEDRVPHGVDATVNPMETSSREAARHGAALHAERPQLGSAHYSVLAARERRDSAITRG